MLKLSILPTEVSVVLGWRLLSLMVLILRIVRVLNVNHGRVLGVVETYHSLSHCRILRVWQLLIR